MAAFEFMDKEVLDHVGTEVPIPLKNGDGENYRFCVLVETQGSNADHDNLKLEAFLEKAMEDGNVVDGVVAQDLTQVRSCMFVCVYFDTWSAIFVSIFYDVILPTFSNTCFFFAICP